MKKIVMFVLMVIFIICVAGCAFNRRNEYDYPINEGTYSFFDEGNIKIKVFEDTFTYLDSIEMSFTEITRKEFEKTEYKNVVADFSYKYYKRKYYSVSLVVCHEGLEQLIDIETEDWAVAKMKHFYTWVIESKQINLYLSFNENSISFYSEGSGNEYTLV